MNEWKSTKLGEYVNSISETYRFKPNEKVVFLNTSDILLGRVINQELQNSKELPGQAKKRIQKGDLLFSEIRPANGRYAAIDFDVENYVVSTKLMVLRCNEKIDRNFFRIFLTSKEQLEYLQMIAEDRSGTFPQITFDHISNLDIILPSLPEQKAIASVLSSIDDKIDLLHRQNKTLESMAETLFRQWFVEHADDKMINLGEFARNVKVNAKVEDLKTHEHYVGLEHIPRKCIALSNWGNTDSLESNKSIFEKNDILFGKLRSYFHKVVFAPINGVCSTDILVIRPKTPEWFSFCLFWFFNKDVVEHSDLGSGGTRMPRTNWNIVASYKIPKPNLRTIEEFDIIARPMIDKISSNIIQIHNLEKMRDALLPKLMSGEVRVAI